MNDDKEELLVEKLISATWRWKRLVKVEGQIFDNDNGEKRQERLSRNLHNRG